MGYLKRINTEDKLRIVIFIILAFIVSGLFSGCENPLAKIIAADTAPRYGVIIIRQDNVDLESGSAIFDFGSVTVGEALTVNFTIVNSGEKELALTGEPLVGIGGTGAAAFSVMSMPGSRIAAGDTTQFSVNFTPASAGNHIASVTVESDAEKNTSFSFSIIGTGVEPPEPEIMVTTSTGTLISSGGNFDFGSTDIVNPKEYSFVIENNGDGDLLLTGDPIISFTGTDAADFSATLLPSTPIPPDGSSSFTIQLESSEIETKSAALVIVNNDTDEGTYIINLTGEVTAEPAPEIHILQGTTDIPCDTDTGTYEYSFDDTTLENTTDVVFTIENKGTADLHLIGGDVVEVSGADFTDTSQPATTITGGATTSFTIRFDPSSTGDKTATVSIVNDDEDEATYTFDIEGTAIDPQINVKQGVGAIECGTGSYIFADTTLGTYTDVTFTIENPGTTELLLTGTPTVALSGTDAGQYGVTASPSSPVAASGGSTAFTVRFEPDSFGVKDATITIENNDGDENPYAFSISGQCTGPEIDVNQGGTDIADGGSYIFEDTRLDIPRDIIFTIENNGDEDLILNGAPLVDIGGTDADLFTVTADPSSSVSGSGSTTFSLQFTPDTPGEKSAVVTILNDDFDEGTYSFTVNGTGWTVTQIVNSTAQSHPCLVADGDNVYICYSDYNISTGYYLILAKSTDCGITWPESERKTIFSEGDAAYYYPSMAVSGSTIYVIYGDYANMELRLIKSTDSGETWPEASIRTVDPYQSSISGSLNVSGSTLYVSYNTGDIRFIKSTDGGNTWPYTNSENVAWSSSSYSTFTSIAVSEDDVYISFINGDTRYIQCAKSADGGANWTVRNIDYYDTTSGPYDTSVKVYGENVYLAYMRYPFNTYLSFAKSEDSGINWTTNGYVGSAHTGDSVSLAVSGEVLHISCANNDSGALMYYRSPDGGTSWDTGVSVDTHCNRWNGTSIEVTGDVVMISYSGSGGLMIARSNDNGVTW